MAAITNALGVWVS